MKVYFESETGMIFECNPTYGAFLAYDGNRSFVIHKSILREKLRLGYVTEIGTL